MAGFFLPGFGRILEEIVGTPPTAQIRKLFNFVCLKYRGDTRKIGIPMNNIFTRL